MESQAGKRRHECVCSKLAQPGQQCALPELPSGYSKGAMNSEAISTSPSDVRSVILCTGQTGLTYPAGQLAHIACVDDQNVACEYTSSCAGAFFREHCSFIFRWCLSPAVQSTWPECIFQEPLLPAFSLAHTDAKLKSLGSFRAGICFF